VRLEASGTSAPVDLPVFVATLPVLADRWRALTFEGGVLMMDDGTRKSGLAIEGGEHPRPGTQYRIAHRANADRVDLRTVELLDDDTSRIRVRFADLDEHFQADVTVRRPADPDRLEAHYASDVPGNWLVRGVLTADVNVDLTRLQNARSSRPQVRVAIRNRHMRAVVDITLKASGRREWTTSVVASVHGVGVLRPVVAALSPVMKPALARQLKRGLDTLSDRVDACNKEVSATFGSPLSPERIAEHVMSDFLADID
jgi:hypothetical protein